MIYTKEQFIKEVEFMIENGYSTSSIAKSIWEKYSDVCDQIDAELDSAMMTLIAMDEGKEFEMNKEEIRMFLENLKSKKMKRVTRKEQLKQLER